MAFLRTKRIHGKTYYYLVESYKVLGKGKQRVLKYYGKRCPSDNDLKEDIKNHGQQGTTQNSRGVRKEDSKG